MQRLRRAAMLAGLITLSACGGNAGPRDVITRWADAARMGDYATAKGLMGMGEFLNEQWQGLHERYRSAGRLHAYTIVDGPIAVGQSYNAVLRWTGARAPLCVTVQVTPANTITVQSNYDTCPEQFR